MAGSSPRERRCPDLRAYQAPSSDVLSARAEVSRMSCGVNILIAGPLRASGGVPARLTSEPQQDGSSPRERRCPVVEAVGAVGGVVLSARAEVSRRAWRAPRPSRGPLRASGGVPLQSGRRGSAPPSSPRERRCPGDRRARMGTGEVLSARAEVSRTTRTGRAGRTCPLRANGGVPHCTGCGTDHDPSSPRERRCPGAVDDGRAEGVVLSARAEVSRAGAGRPGGRHRPLRASGGVPAV